MSATRLGDDVVLHFTDFTKLKQLQMQLENKVDELQRSNRNLGEFAHAASHDLKEPIRKIQVFISQLKEQLSGSNPENFPVISKIENSAERMSQLIEDLIQYSHVSDHPVEKEQVDLNDSLISVLEELELTITQHKAVIKSEVLPLVNGYSRQLQQLIQNLVSNAIKYSKQDATPIIDIAAQVELVDGRKYHKVSIKDNGIGFDQSYEQKIFEMFARLHGRDQYAGNGIGLAIVKKIVDNHQGFIKATGVVGEGATFDIYLPE